MLIALPLLHFAQEFNIETRVEARLESVLILNVDPEIKIEFAISEVNDNLYQVIKPPDDINFSVESTGNWDLSITASDPYFTGVNDPTQKIPVDFVGFSIENRGDNWDNGLFSNIANRTKDTIISLSDKRKWVLTNGNRSNIGGSNRNAFVLRWKFIYEDDAKKIRKFSNLDIKDDLFIGRFYITLSEKRVSGTSINIPDYAPVKTPVKTEPVISGETTPTTLGQLEKLNNKKK